MDKKKIAYLPVLNFNDPADLYSRLLGAESDMMEEGLTIFHQEDYSLCPQAVRENEVGLLPWPNDEDLVNVIGRRELEDIRVFDVEGEALELFLKRAGITSSLRAIGTSCSSWPTERALRSWCAISKKRTA